MPRELLRGHHPTLPNGQTRRARVTSLVARRRDLLIREDRCVMVFIDRSLNSDKRKRSRELEYQGDDRRVPFAQDEIASLSGDNVSESDVEIETFIVLYRFRERLTGHR